ncbi:enamelin [Aulostomus maculatus]
MKPVIILICLLVASLAAPVPEQSKEQVAAHANEALRWMEMYRMYQQQGVVRNPFLPDGTPPVEPAGPVVVDAVPAPVPVTSDEETEE